jgi:hypothetical protein
MLPGFFKGETNVLPLTYANQELERLVRRTPEGMMFWSGTCADPTATCSGCRHFGYDTVVRDAAGNALTAHKRPTSCALYKKHMERDGAPLDPKTPACKYFEVRRP